MHSQVRLLRLIADGEFHSEEKLGAILGLSRTAVCNAINSLGRYGLMVDAMRGKGYRLSQPIEFLDREKLLSAIDLDAVKLIRRLDIFEEIDSTSQYLLERSQKHACVVLAEYQNCGRGRRGSCWLSPLGAGLNLSIGWHFDKPAVSLNWLALASGVAVARALGSMGFDGIELKWPNDIFFRGKKLGGLLVETRGEIAGQSDVVLGVGLNIAVPVGFKEQIDQPYTALAEVKATLPERNRIVTSVISELVVLLQHHIECGTEAILDEWRRYDCMRGRRVTLKSQDCEISGLVLGIDGDGALMMSTNRGVQRYVAGEIRVRSGA